MELAEVIGARPVPCAGVLLTVTPRGPITCAHCSASATMDGTDPTAADLRRFVGSLAAPTTAAPPAPVAELARTARVAGTCSAVLTGGFFARDGRLPQRIRRAVRAVDHVSVSIDAFHEREVPRESVFLVLRHLLDRRTGQRARGRQRPGRPVPGRPPRRHRPGVRRPGAHARQLGPAGRTGRLLGRARWPRGRRPSGAARPRTSRAPRSSEPPTAREGSTVNCGSCGVGTPPDAGFCPACGTPVAPAPSAVPTAERKLVTVVFCDLVGSTALSEALDPETLRVVTLRYFAAMRMQIERYCGTVENCIGDAVMAVFGVPAMHEDAWRWFDAKGYRAGADHARRLRAHPGTASSAHAL